jgi:hypothetical protein
MDDDAPDGPPDVRQRRLRQQILSKLFDGRIDGGRTGTRSRRRRLRAG